MGPPGRQNDPRNAGRAAGWLAAGVPLAGVLAFDPGGLMPFGPAKWALLGPMVLGALSCGVSSSGRVRVASAVAWAVLLAWVVVATLAGADGLLAWIGTPERRYGALTWFVAAAAFAAGQLLDDDGRRRVRRATTLAGGVLGVWVVAEELGWRPLDLVGAGGRPVGTLGSSAYVGAAAVLLAGVAMGEALDISASRAWRTIAGGSASLATFALVASGARAAWVGAVVVVVVAARHRPPVRVVAAVVGALAAAVLVTGVGARVPAAFETDQGGARGRLDEWHVATRAIAAHELTGVGPEGYRIAFGRAVDDRYEQVHGRDPLPDRAHSAPLDVAATLGLPGLAAWIALLMVVGARLDRTWVTVAVAAYLVQSIFLFPLAELDPIAWLLAGTATIVPESYGGRRTGAARLVAAAGAVGALVLAVVGTVGVIADRKARDDPAAAARLRPDVVRYRLGAALDHEEVGSSASLDRAIAAVGDAARISPRDPVVRSEMARLLLSKARRTGAAHHLAAATLALEDAVADDPRTAALLLRLGVARSLAGDDAGAEQAWRSAERLAPRSAAASADLALAYVRQGRFDDATAAARRALDRDPDNDAARQVLESIQDADGT